MRILLLLMCAAGLAQSDPPTLTFTKSFPGSDPAYESVQISRSGSLQYKEAAAEDQPVTATLAEADTAAVFAMADQLNHFKDPIESGLKVANTGKKTFRYADATGQATETVFNYSENQTAQHLLDRLEQICASERAWIDLDRTMHFDKLGVNDSLAVVESLWLRKQLAAPDQFVPLLNRIIAHDAFMHLVRERAARLRDDFQAGHSNPAQQAP